MQLKFSSVLRSVLLSCIAAGNMCLMTSTCLAAPLNIRHTTCACLGSTCASETNADVFWNADNGRAFHQPSFKVILALDSWKRALKMSADVSFLRLLVANPAGVQLCSIPPKGQAQLDSSVFTCAEQLSSPVTKAFQDIGDSDVPGRSPRGAYRKGGAAENRKHEAGA